MDTDGNVFFRRDDGGQIVLQSFTSQLEKPEVGLREVVRESVALTNGSVPLTVNLTSNSTGSSNYSPVSGGGNQAIAEISVTTQDGASTAMVRSTLLWLMFKQKDQPWFIQNRLTHTIDNLSNIVTSTSAAQSRIRDTDYERI